MYRPRLVAVTLAVLLILGTTSVVAAGDDSAALNGPGAMQPPMTGGGNPYNPPAAVKPDYAKTSGGRRIEVYTSTGNNDVSSDWRTVNEYAYLVDSVPKDKNLYSTVYNSLWDGDQAVYDSATSTWGVQRPAGVTHGVFGVTQAYLNLLNRYTTSAERKKYVHILSNKTTIQAALDAGSGLASLVTRATDYHYCTNGSGACLTTRTGENYMHAKYAAFEQARDSEGNLWDNVTWITSSNLNGASGGSKSNTSIAVFGDAAAYNGIVNTIYKAETSACSARPVVRPCVTFTDAFKAAQTGIVTDTPGLTYYPSPRTVYSSNSNDRDYEDQALHALATTAPTTPGGKSGWNCRVYLVHSLFSRTVIRDDLAALASQGCDVRLVIGNNATSDLASFYFENAATTREIISGVQFANVHDKTLSAYWTQPGGSPQGFAFGGSANFNSTSLQYDELAFKSTDPAVTQAVQQQAARLYQYAKGSTIDKPVTSFSLNPATPSVAVGSTVRMGATFAPADASVKMLTWSSDDPSIATVGTDGTITGVRSGTTTVRALSVSGSTQQSVPVTVTSGGTTTGGGTSNLTPVVVDTPPEMTMQPYQFSNESTKVVVTWSQGNVDLSGTVQLQYYSGGWKDYQSITITGGRGTRTFSFAGSHTWRARVTSMTSPPTVATWDSRATPLMTDGYSLSTVKTTASTSKPRIYAPNRVISTHNVPFLFTWDNPYAGRAGIKNDMRLQYWTGRTWKTLDTVSIDPGDTFVKVDWPVTATHKWRAISGVKAVPSGHSAYVSSSVTVSTTKKP